MRRSRQLVAGLLDSAFAALGTFLAGVLAVRELDVRLLAAYAIVAAAGIFAMPLSRQLVYIPSQIAANVRTEVRVPVLRHEIRRALPFSAASALIVVVVGISLTGGRDLAGVLALTLTAAAMVVVSPLQDHVRSCLHLSGLHLRAAACSVVLALAVGIAVVLASVLPHAQDVVALVPFGALTLANLLSAAVGVVLLRRTPRVVGYRPSPIGDRTRFLLSEVAVQGAWLVCTYLILLLAGSAAVAALEAARVAAAPVFILSAALSTFLAPALLRRLNPDAPDRAGAVRELGVAVGVLFGGAFAWIVVLALAGDWVGLVLNKPFDLPLTALRAAAASAEGIGSLVGIAMIALSQARQILRFSLLAAAIAVAGTAALAVPVGAVALPVAQGVGMLVRLALNSDAALRGIDRRVAVAQRMPTA